jgi:hypothetical protein
MLDKLSYPRGIRYAKNGGLHAVYITIIVALFLIIERYVLKKILELHKEATKIYI